MDRNQTRVLIVDDEKELGHLYVRVLEAEGLTASLACDGETALDMIKLGIPDVVLLDIRMPGIDGMEVLRQAKTLEPDLPVLMMTAYGGIDGAVQSLKEGAFDYLTKPIDHRDLVRRIRQALAAGKSAHKVAHTSTKPHDSAGADLIPTMGPSDAVRRISSEVALVARSNFTVVIQGETGTGKELVARHLHRASSRAERPLVAVDCGAVPETLFESEFFGHEKGAFTGAACARSGKMEMAQGGTLFLDEIGHLPYHSQIKLLRSIQERVFFRIGGQKPVEVDFRLLVATNQDLNKAVLEARFCRDLYYRLNEFVIVIPPLRERKEDILHLAHRFLQSTNLELGKSVKGFSQSATDALLDYDWPGNVRQLRSSIRRAVLEADVLINPDHLLAGAGSANLPNSELKTQDLGWLGVPLREVVRRTISEVEKRVITQTLRKTGGNKAQAARLLQVDYKTIHTKIKKYGINFQEGNDDQEDEEHGER